MTTILLVEDNELNRDMLGRRLRRRGFVVHEAVDGRQGVDMTKELMPDLVIMDMELPVLNGWDATRELKADEGTKAIPVLALTAYAMSTDRQKTLDAGCDDYDTKPIDFQRLLAKLDQLLSQSQGQS